MHPHTPLRTILSIILGLLFLTPFVESWLSSSASAATLSCIESDRGDVKEKAGFARVQSATEGVVSSKADVCTDDVLTEYYCTAQGAIAETTYTCSGGCSQGACLATVVAPPSAAAIERRKGRAGRLSGGKTSFKRYFLNPRKIFRVQPSAPRRLPVPPPSVSPQ